VTLPESEASAAPTPDDSLALAARAGIHRLAIPTPFAVGRVNCYLIEDDPLTLVDTGPNSGKSLDELEQALAGYGRTIEELELIVLTHQHVDHLGLLEILARRSGAEVAAFHELTGYLANFSASAAADDEFAQTIMRMHGVPEDLATVLGSVGSAFRVFGSSGRVTHPLHDGDTLALRDRRFRVLHRPGHSPSDTIFFDEDRRILIGGDHLLAKISSNPVMSRPLAGDATSVRPPALLNYIESMRATKELPAELVLPGHGEPITDHGSLIDERFRMHQRRARKVLGIIAAGPVTAYEIALAIWGNVAVTQAYLTLSEVLGHLDLLIRDGQAAQTESDGVIRFESLEPAAH
jgi:glyoxylase-like metal-dependent hydrolase (beta-lactamase superfamily II)